MKIFALNLFISLFFIGCAGQSVDELLQESTNTDETIEEEINEQNSTYTYNLLTGECLNSNGEIGWNEYIEDIESLECVDLSYIDVPDFDPEKIEFIGLNLQGSFINKDHKLKIRDFLNNFILIDENTVFERRDDFFERIENKLEKRLDRKKIRIDKVLVKIDRAKERINTISEKLLIEVKIVKIDKYKTKLVLLEAKLEYLERRKAILEYHISFYESLLDKI